MKQHDDKWEERINALLDGKLGETGAGQLKAAATDDRELARAIVEAYRLQQAMDSIQIERAPASLRKRLRAIPRRGKAKFLQPRWVMTLATIPLVIIAVSLMQPKTPSADEVAKARLELAVAFAYLDRAGQFTGREIELKVGNTMADAIAGSVIRNTKSQYETSKEKET